MEILRTVAATVAVLIWAAPTFSDAQNVKTIADREAARRQSAVPRGEDIAAHAEAELRAQQFAQAHEDFRVALTYLSDSPAVSRSHSKAMEGFCQSGVKLAEQRIAEGKYAEAEQILNEVLSERYNSNCREARALLAHLHEAGYINRTMGPKFL